MARAPIVGAINIREVVQYSNDHFSRRYATADSPQLVEDGATHLSIRQQSLACLWSNRSDDLRIHGDLVKAKGLIQRSQLLDQRLRASIQHA